MWLLYVLSDEKVETWEGILTFCFFWIMLLMAYIADCCRAAAMKKREEEKYGAFEVKNMSIVDFYEKLIPLEKGEEVSEKDREVTQQMKQFLKKEFGTASIQNVDKDALKQKLAGDHMIERIGYRKKVALNGHKEAIEKGAIIRTQNKSA